MEKLWIGAIVIFLIIICPVFLIYIATHWSFTGILIGWILLTIAAYAGYRIMKRPATQRPQ